MNEAVRPAGSGRRGFLRFGRCGPGRCGTVSFRLAQARRSCVLRLFLVLAALGHCTVAMAADGYDCTLSRADPTPMALALTPLNRPVMQVVSDEGTSLCEYFEEPKVLADIGLDFAAQGFELTAEMIVMCDEPPNHLVLVISESDILLQGKPAGGNSVLTATEVGIVGLGTFSSRKSS